MNLNDKSHLNLFFPQWQGSDRKNTLYYGAQYLKGSFNNILFSEIEVPEHETLEISNHILGYDSVLSQLNEAVSLIKDMAPESILTIGGDCAVDIAPVSWLNHLYGKNFCLVWLDAHSDINTPESSPSKCFHGMPLRILLGEGDEKIVRACPPRLLPEQVILAGVRALDIPEQEYIDLKGIKNYPVDILTSDPQSLVDEIQKRNFDNVYIHIDLDVLDSGIYKNIKHPTPNGITPETLTSLVSTLNASVNVVGMSILEFVRIQDKGVEELHPLLECFG